jgi:stalled ribosome alternative rescue factor ArfA
MMAKIRVFSKTKEISKSMEGLSGKMDELKSNMDQYFRLLTEAKAKAERKARELEKIRKQEELAAEQSRREEQIQLETEKQEKQLKDIELQGQQQERQKDKKGSYNRTDEKASHSAKHVEEESQTNQEKVMDIPAQDSLKQSVKDKPTKQAHTERAAAKHREILKKWQADAVQSDDFKDRKSYGDRRAQRGRRKADIVEKFLSQPPIIAEKDKAESGKGSGGRFAPIKAETEAEEIKKIFGKIISITIS